MLQVVFSFAFIERAILLQVHRVLDTTLGLSRAAVLVWLLVAEERRQNTGSVLLRGIFWRFWRSEKSSFRPDSDVARRRLQAKAGGLERRNLSLSEQTQNLRRSRSEPRVRLQARFKYRKQRLGDGLELFRGDVSLQNLLLHEPVVASAVEQILFVDEKV